MKFDFEYEFEGLNANHWIVTVESMVNGKLVSSTGVFEDGVTLNEVYSWMTDIFAMDALEAMSPYM